MKLLLAQYGMFVVRNMVISQNKISKIDPYLACPGGAVGSVAVHTAWLRLSASLGSSRVVFAVKSSVEYRGAKGRKRARE